jgi:hypothetical protein
MPVSSTDTGNDVKAAYDSLEQFDRDSRYIDEHFEELWQQHRDQWVAVYQGQVVAIEPDIQTLVRSVEQKGIPIENAARRKLVKDVDLIV